MRLQLLLPTQLRQVGLAEQNGSKIKTKKYINFRHHQNSAIDIVADIGSPVIDDIRIFYGRI